MGPEIPRAVQSRLVLALGLLLVGAVPLAGAPSLPLDLVPPLRFSHFTVDDGLSNSWVRAMLKDHRGFVWIATLGGLDRYDGGSLVHYRAVPTDPHSLISPEVWSLFEDRRNRLWVAAGGLHLYDRDRDRFERQTVARGPGATGDLTIRIIRGDRLGRLWLGTESEGLFRFDPEQGTSWRYAHDPASPASLASDEVVGLLCDRRGRIWVGTRRGLDRFDEGTETFVHVLRGVGIPERIRRAAETSLLVESMHEAEDGTLWLGTMGEGLIHFDPDRGTATHVLPDAADPGSLSGLRVSAVTGDRTGAIYVGVENAGLDVFDPQTKKFIHYRPDLEDPQSLASASIWSLSFDDQGILWVGTYNAGVDSVSPFGQPFGFMRPRPGGLSNPHVLAVIGDHRGDLWIGTDGGGLNRIDRKTGHVSYFRHEPSNPRSLGSDAVVSLLEDRHRNIWIGTWAAGLYRLDPRTSRLDHFPRGPDSPQSFAEWTLVEDRDGKLLVGLRGVGVDVLDPSNGRYTRLSRVYPGAGESGEVYAIALDAHGNLWLGSTTGLEFVDRATRHVEHYPFDPHNPSSPAPGFVYAVRPDSRGNVWVGTEAGGLACLAATTRQVRRYSQADGLPDDNIGSILEDESGNLWLATTRGLAKFERAVELPDKPRFLTFDVHDGLPGNEFRHGAAFKSRTGEMFFGGQRGLCSFFPDRVRRNVNVPPVLFTEMRLFGKPAAIGEPGSPLEKAITETTELTLSYRHTVLSFDFVALSFILPAKNRYAYKLEGFDPDWSRPGTQRTATYTSLPPGSYVLRVRAANNDGVWNEEGAALRIKVTPPLWQMPLFRLATVALAAGLLFLGHRLRTRRIHAHARELSEQVAERTRDLNRLNEALEERVAERTLELEAEKERLAVTLRSIGDGVIATDVLGRVVLMNRVAELLAGWTAEEAYERPLRTVLPVIDRQTRELLPDPVESVMKNGGALELPGQSLLVRRDATEVLIADSAAPIRDRQSRIVGVVLVFRDVTERRKVEEQLQSSQRLESLGILAGGIAHDFNNLLTGIFGYVDIARSRPTADPPTRETLGKALSVLDRARGLTSQLLTFSRAGQPVTAPLALGNLLRDCLRFALSGSDVDCQLSVPDDLWACEGDERQIDQVIDNLLLNARQAMPAGGTIRVTARNVLVPADVEIPIVPGRYVSVTVSDRGAGIPAELQTQIFEPFFTTKPGGSGLGLATSYSIVRKHGGHIQVSSAPGEGATFVVYLPAASTAARPAPSPLPEMPRGVGRILIMDDEEYLRDVLSTILSELGYSPEAVVDGEAAVRLFEQACASPHPFDLAILDLTVPGGTGGLAALPRLKALDPTVRAIAASGYSGHPVMANPGESGFAGTLTKPFTLAEVASVVARTLDRSVH